MPGTIGNSLATILVIFFTNTYMFLYGCVTSILTPAATAVHHVWDNYYPLLEHVVMPHSALNFIITVLLVFAEIKAQGHPDFPFKTHPLLLRFSINSVVMYGLSCAAELVASGFDPTSVFVNFARLGKICSLCILVISLACLFYF